MTRTSTTALRQREKGGNVQRDRGRKRERGRKCMRRRWKTTEQRGDRARRKGMRVGDRERQREREREREKISCSGHKTQDLQFCSQDVVRLTTGVKEDRECQMKCGVNF